MSRVKEGQGGAQSSPLQRVHRKGRRVPCGYFWPRRYDNVPCGARGARRRVDGRLHLPGRRAVRIARNYDKRPRRGAHARGGRGEGGDEAREDPAARNGRFRYCNAFDRRLLAVQEGRPLSREPGGIAQHPGGHNDELAGICRPPFGEGHHLNGRRLPRVHNHGGLQLDLPRALDCHQRYQVRLPSRRPLELGEDMCHIAHLPPAPGAPRRPPCSRGCHHDEPPRGLTRVG
mmetsp:Transcript_37417/g.117894  ORF Transcript_37417/g.117894 Transcript_37417/m.117894 type:complete len:231 (-) Transcript_37417:1993-2685(-)